MSLTELFWVLKHDELAIMVVDGDALREELAPCDWHVLSVVLQDIEVLCLGLGLGLRLSLGLRLRLVLRVWQHPCFIAVHHGGCGEHESRTRNGFTRDIYNKHELNTILNAKINSFQNQFLWREHPLR